MQEISCDTCKGEFWQTENETTCQSCVVTAKQPMKAPAKPAPAKVDK